MQRDVAVVAELAERDLQPVPVAHLHDSAGVEAAELTGSDPGPQQQVDHQPAQLVGVGAGGPEQRGGLGVVEELRQGRVDHG